MVKRQGLLRVSGSSDRTTPGRVFVEREPEGGPRMEESREALLEEIERHRHAIEGLEERLRRLEADEQSAWPPQEFYTTYYVVVGMIIGIMGALVSFFFNVVGSMFINQDPLMLIRVFGTLFRGREALTTGDQNFIMLVLMVHFTVGALGGAVYHVVVNQRYADRPFHHKILLGVGWGLAIWIVNFYLVLSWLQPMRVGEALILRMIPFWVAALTHIVYGLTLGLLQPIGRFVPYSQPR
jgi:hypothetical protein